MKTFFSVLLFALQCFFICKITVAQNLVPNHSFEVYDTCPDFFSQINRANHWFQPTTGTPDYFNECFIPNPYPNTDVPTNGPGFQYAKEGVAYGGGFFFFNAIFTYREYLAVKLAVPLVEGTLYYVKYYVSLSDSSLYATDRIGAFFSKDSIYSNNFSALPYLPQIENGSGNFIIDTMHWTKIQGSYQAQGGEQFLVLGNFHDQEETDTLRIQPVSSPVFGPHGYYYVDDVCVTIDSTTCDVELNVTEPIVIDNWNCYMDYSNQLCWIKSTSMINSVDLINVLGQLQEKQYFEAESNSISVNTRNLPAGTYLIKATTEKRVFIAKVLVIH